MNFFCNATEFSEAYPDKIKNLVFTNGCFDILHVGHVRCLKAIRELGDFLVVGLNSDQSVRVLKGPKRPINDEQSRAEVLLALECVDAVILFHEETPKALIEKLDPSILAKGGDYKVEEIAGSKWVLDHGGRVEIIPFVPGFSTTSILEKNQPS